MCHAIASATAPEIQAVTMQLLFIKYKGEIHLASGSIVCPTNQRALFSSEQMSFFTLFYAALLHASKHMNALRSFFTVLWKTVIPELTGRDAEDIGRHNFYSTHRLVYYLLLVIGLVETS